MKIHDNFVGTSLRAQLLAGSAAVSLSFILGAWPAYAQEDMLADDEETLTDEELIDESDERVVVTGFRAALESAIANKRDANSIIESITAEDIGRLPDISIAEALARLPGISSQRITGQASALNIRGLSQQLTFVTLNGREQVTPNGNRSAEFEQFPSELIAGADVYKSPTAGLIEGGLAGTVELKTIRPLSRGERVITVNARGIYNDRADEIFDADDFGYRISLSYVDQFFDNTLGVAFGYARLVQPDVSTRFVGFDYDGFAPNDFNGDGRNDNVSFGFETEEQGGTDTRDGLIGTVQWQPTENLNIEVDAYYSNFESESFGRGVRVIGPQAANFGNPNTLVTDPVVAGQALVGGLLRRNVEAPTDPANPSQFGLTFQGINDNQFSEDELFSVGTKVEWENERFRISGDFTYSEATSFFANEVANILPIVSLDGGVPGQSNSLPATPVMAADQEVFYRLNGTDIPRVDFANDLTDRSVARLANFGAFPFENDDELFAYEGEFEYFTGDWPILSSIEVGVRYSEREASQFRESAGGGFGNDAGFFQFAGMPFEPIELTNRNSSVECFSGEFRDAGFPCYLVIEDPRALFESVNGRIELNQNEGFTQSESFTINEDVLAGYFQFNLETELFGIPMTGNAGVRVVRTEQVSSNQAAEGTALARAGENNFTRVLPSVNLVFLLSDRDQLRLGGSRALSRPPLFQLGSGIGVGIAGNQPSGGGAGNPALVPFLSNNGDISFERYFDNGGIFTLAGFYKSLETFIVDDTDPNFDFEEAGFRSALEELDQFPQLTTFVGPFSGPINGEGGYIWGIEAAYSQAFDFLPGFWSGLGISMNYAYTDSEINFDSALSGASLTLPLPGLSDHVFNGTVYYEWAGFSNRVGIRYRSEFVSPQVGINRQLPFTDSEVVVDYQASYDFPLDSRLAGLTILFQANNLTDEPVTTFFGEEAQTGTIQKFGRVFFFGASYTY